MGIDSDNMVRVAILSDTHGHICPDVMAAVETCDMAVHAGDIGCASVLEMMHAGTGAAQPVGRLSVTAVSG